MKDSVLPGHLWVSDLPLSSRKTGSDTVCPHVHIPKNCFDPLNSADVIGHWYLGCFTNP